MKKRVSFLVLALLIAISGCGKSESNLNGQDSNEEINANGTGEDGTAEKAPEVGDSNLCGAGGGGFCDAGYHWKHNPLCARIIVRADSRKAAGFFLWCEN